MNNNNGSEVFFGGVVVVIIIVIITSKLLRKLFNELKLTFSAFAEVAGSFFEMLLPIGKVVLFVALVLACVASAIYFTYRYVLLVYKATALQEQQRAESLRLENLVDDKLEKFERKISFLADRLEEALKPPEVAPEAKAILEKPVQEEAEPNKKIKQDSSPNESADSNYKNQSPANQELASQIQSSLNPY